jgi:two-component system, chemotaxis family, sensor histidine kinase and response regulator PixL
MAPDSEQQVRLQFLDEAWDYIDQIESGLLGISSRSVDRSVWDGVLRAAHSIKGGAAMMSYPTLSHLAHRLEDNFKVIKTNPTKHLDSTLEQLLLTGVDHLRQVAGVYRSSQSLDENWLSQVVHPTFDHLLELLGEPTAEDSTTLLSEEMGEDVALMLFESEVEGTLTRLEEVLADPAQTCLKEEFTIAVQELAGLGEMLDLPAFARLCSSIETYLTEAEQSARLEAITQQALQTLRQAQAMVLIGQQSLIPEALSLEAASAKMEGLEDAASTLSLDLELDTVLDLDLDLELDTIVPEGEEALPETLDFLDTLDLDAATAITAIDSDSLAAIDLTDFSVFEEQEALTASDSESAATQSFSCVTEAFSVPEQVNEPPELLELPELAPSSHNQEGVPDELALAALEPTTDLSDFNPYTDTLVDAFAAFDLEAALAPPQPQAQSPEPPKVLPQPPQPQPKSQQTKTTSRSQTVSKATTSESEDQTLRVSLRQLNHLNELFGELIIERNGLSLYLKRIREQMALLSQRVQTLEQSNTQLRSAYDKVATATLAQHHPGIEPSLPQPLGSESLAPFSTDFTQTFDLLEMDRYSELHSFSQELMETAVQIQEVTVDLNTHLQEAEQTTRELTRTTKQLQVGLTQLRMRPLSDVVSRYPRMLRDWALQYGKDVDLKITGASTLIDRSILDVLSDPLLHILRNAYDHGIEDPQRRLETGKSAQGQIEMTAAYRGNQTLITIRDDGGGIPLDKIKAKAAKLGLDAETLESASESQLLDLIFEPGFSTAAEVTELSGRGVGMDIVRTNLEKVGGTITVTTQAGAGTTFMIAVPYTLSVIRVLLVESGNLTYAFPTDAVEEMRLLKSEELLEINGQPLLPWENLQIPLISLNRWLRSQRPLHLTERDATPTISQPTVLIVGVEEQAYALQVERYWGEQEVTIRQVEGELPLPTGFAGCTILGDGRIAPLVDPIALLNHISAQQTTESLAQQLAELDPFFESVDKGGVETADTIANQPTILVVDDSVNVRRFMAITLAKAGFRVEQAKDGQDALDKLNLNLPIQAIVCDVEMPRLDGFGFLAHAKADPEKKHIPVVMLTSRSGDKHRKLATRLGASAYFSKPFREQELLTTLTELIHSPVVEIPV